MVSSRKAVFLFGALLASAWAEQIEDEADEGQHPSALSEEDVDEQDVFHPDDAFTADELSTMHKLFDADGNGLASFSEVMSFLVETSRGIKVKTAYDYFEHLDTDNDGHFSAAEHTAELTRIPAEPHQHDIDGHVVAEQEKFRVADVNGDGQLDQQELPGLFFPEMNEAALALVVNASMREKDTDGDARLSAEEFLGAVGEDVAVHGRADFEALDRDGDGYLSSDELSLWESGSYHSEEAMIVLFKLVDADDDKHITAEELAAASEDIARSDAQHHLESWAEHHEL